MFLHSAALALLLAATLRAASIDSPRLTLDQTSNTSPPVETPSYATGDWFGLRPALDHRGLTLAGLVELDTTKVLRGGIDTDHTPVRYLFDLNLALDTDQAFHWPGGKLFFDLQTHDGPNPSPHTVGDVQGFDSIDGAHFIQISQLWYQQTFANTPLHAKAGKIDANADFSVIDHGTEFLNTAAAYSPTMFPMVTYPDPAPGAELFFQPTDLFYAGIGAFYSNRSDGFLNLVGHPQSVERAAGGTFLLTEIGSRWKIPFSHTDLPGHAGVGGWYHTGEYPRIRNPNEFVHGSGGTYLFLDQTLWTQDAADHHPTPNLGFFFDAGYADPRTNQMDEQLGGGFAATGFIPGRPNDILGALASWSHLPAQPFIYQREELVIEAFYRLQLLRCFSLKPDFQYIISPSGRYPDAAVITLRAQLDF
jgi:carbohydrate-selective porin OprB